MPLSKNAYLLQGKFSWKIYTLDWTRWNVEACVNEHFVKAVFTLLREMLWLAH